jgi:hypothetical protein
MREVRSSRPAGFALTKANQGFRVRHSARTQPSQSNQLSARPSFEMELPRTAGVEPREHCVSLCSWVREARGDDDEGGGEVASAPPRAPTPLTREYWTAQARHRIGEIVSSHTVKYPYSFYALAKDVKDEELKKRILAKVYRLTATN